jgi:hypothetical protein
MLWSAAGVRSPGWRCKAFAGLLVAAVSLIAPQVAAATGNVTVTVNPPQFDPKDGNYAVFSGSVTNAPMPDGDSGCIPFGGEGCLAQFMLTPAGINGNFQIGPGLIWGIQTAPNPTQVSATINLGTSPDVVPGPYHLQLWAYDTGGQVWKSGTVQFNWPPTKLTLTKVQLGQSPGGHSTISYVLSHGGTPFAGKARVTGSVFDGSQRLGGFVDKIKAGTRTRLLPRRIDRRLVPGHSYRIRLDAKDPLGREAHFRGKRER